MPPDGEGVTFTCVGTAPEGEVATGCGTPPALVGTELPVDVRDIGGTVLPVDVRGTAGCPGGALRCCEVIVRGAAGCAGVIVRDTGIELGVAVRGSAGRCCVAAPS